MEIRLLGPLDVVDDGASLDLGPRKQRALLALLALHANRVVATDRILQELWGDDATTKERTLWTVISRLRSALEPDRHGHGESSVLLTRDHGYVLCVDPDEIDLTRFAAGVEQSRRLLQRDPAESVAHIDETLGLWRGTPLGEFRDEEFARLDVARIEELRLEAFELRAEAEIRLGRAREQISTLETLHAEHPLRERFVSLLMRSLYRGGRHAEALRVFDRYRRTIGEELGIEPSPELRRLEEQILLHDPAIGADRRPSADQAPVISLNPFKGLRSFGEDDADEFFGRDRVVSEVVRRLQDGHRLVALVGASGSGKSSIVKAGLIPALRKGTIVDSDVWLIAQMTPGAHPVTELEAALLRSSLDAPDSLSEQLADPEMGLMRAALRVLPANSRLLLVIDQFEELFSLVDSERERQRFLDLLGPALDDPHGRVMVVLTLRADFYDRPLRFPDLAQRLGDGILNVSSLTTDELESAALEPMRRAGVAMEPTLLASLLADVIDRPSALPLFQYTLTRLFDRREGDRVTLDAYRAMGGLRGALAQRADDLWNQLTPQEQVAARQVVLRLVTITGAKEWSRRRVLASELTSMTVDLVAVQRVVELFGQHRLLSFDRDQVTGSPTLEVAHEALLTEWPRLREWIDEAGDDVVRHAALVAAMTEWETSEHNPDYLLVGQRLADYESWAEQTLLELTGNEQKYVHASVVARDDADRDEAERVEREAVLARRVRRRTAGLVLLLLSVAGVTLALWWFSSSEDLRRVAFVGPGFNADESNPHYVQYRAGWERALRESEFEGEELEPRTDAVEEMSAVAASGVDLIVVDSEFGWALPDVAAAHPDTWFVTSERNVPLSYPNVTAVAIDVGTGSYLAGAAAAMTTETGTIGFLGGHIEIIDPFRSGFAAGARAIDPQIEIVSTYLVNDGGVAVFNQPDSGAAAARHLYELGADVVFHAAGSSGAAVPRVAEQMSEELGHHLWVIGVDSDQWLAVEDDEQHHVLTSMIKRQDLETPIAVDRFLRGELEAGVLELGLEDGAVDYSTLGGHLDAEVIEQLDALAAQITAGQIIVPKYPSEPPTTLVDVDTTISAAVSGDSETCSITAPSSIVLGDVIGLDMTNGTDEPQALAVFDEQLNADPAPQVRVFAAAGGSNAGRLRLTNDGTWTFACVDLQDSPTGAVEVAVRAPADAPTIGRITSNGTECAYVGETEISLGSRLVVDLVNASPDEIAFFLSWVDSEDLLLQWSAGPGQSSVGVFPANRRGQLSLTCSNGFNDDGPTAVVFDVTS